MFYLIFGLPIIAAILYVNLIATMKKINKGEDTANNTGWGTFLTALFIFGIIILIISTG